jgi:hypothetical protein
MKILFITYFSVQSTIYSSGKIVTITNTDIIKCAVKPHSRFEKKIVQFDEIL